MTIPGRLAWAVCPAIFASAIGTQFGYGVLAGPGPHPIALLIALATWAVIVLGCLVFPRMYNRVADNEPPAFSPRARRTFLLLFFVAIGFGIGIVKCPHGRYLMFGTQGFALDAPPCNNDRHPIPLIVFLIREMLP